MNDLTYKEREYWRLKCAGLDFREIGARFGVSGNTVKYIIYGAPAKLIRGWQERRSERRQ